MAEHCDPRRPLPDWSTSDTGEADRRLAEAPSRAALLAALVDARVFAAVSAVSVAEELTEHGLRAESTAELAVLLMETDGERALPVFSTVDELGSWRPDARPVPLSGREACRAALDEGASAVVLDPAGRATALASDEVRALAAGFVPVAGSRVAARRGEVSLAAPLQPVPDELVAALRAAVEPEDLRDARLLEGPEGLVLGVVAARPLRPEQLAALGQRVAERLGAALPSGGLDLAQVAPHGAGVPLVRRRWLRRRP